MDANLTQALRVIFVVLHILAALFWLTGFFFSFAFRGLLNSSSERAQTLALRIAQDRIYGMSGAIGGNGILLTGLALLAVDSYGLLSLFGAYTPTWLFIKQVVYIVALVLVFAVIRPAGAKYTVALADAAKGGDIAQVQALAPRLEQYANLSHSLVIVNIVLAVWGTRGGLQ